MSTNNPGPLKKSEEQKLQESTGDPTSHSIRLVDRKEKLTAKSNKGSSLSHITLGFAAAASKHSAVLVADETRLGPGVIVLAKQGHVSDPTGLIPDPPDTRLSGDGSLVLGGNSVAGNKDGISVGSNLTISKGRLNLGSNVVAGGKDEIFVGSENTPGNMVFRTKDANGVRIQGSGQIFLRGEGKERVLINGEKGDITLGTNVTSDTKVGVRLLAAGHIHVGNKNAIHLDGAVGNIVMPNAGQLILGSNVVTANQDEIFVGSENAPGNMIFRTKTTNGVRIQGSGQIFLRGGGKDRVLINGETGDITLGTNVA